MNDALLANQAAALEEIRKMHEDLKTAHTEIGQLKADLHREQDRVTLLSDERNRWRKESHIFRNKLIELATAMANIHLLTAQAATIMTTTRELLDGVDGTDDTPPAADNKAKIDEAVANINLEEPHSNA